MFVCFSSNFTALKSKFPNKSLLFDIIGDPLALYNFVNNYNRDFDLYTLSSAYEFELIIDFWSLIVERIPKKKNKNNEVTSISILFHLCYQYISHLISINRTLWLTQVQLLIYKERWKVGMDKSGRYKYLI